MRAFWCIVDCLFLAASALGQPTAEDPETKWAAARVQQALLQHEPIPWSKSRLVVPTAEVAIGIHTAVVRAAFGETALRDKPFVAVRSGDYWVVHGTLPPGTVGGTPITVIRAKDGAVLWVMSEA
jgi:hypothetical protein